MNYKIPNVGDALYVDQARPNATDFDILVAGISGMSGISTGCAVTTTGAANGSVTVASGTVLNQGVYVSVAAGNVAITSNSSGNPRRDLVTIDNTGAKSTVVGTPGVVPLMPTIPSNRTVLADVYVPNGHTGTSTILAGQITDKRVFAPASDFEGHNVLQYGARGDSHHSAGGGTDDTAAFQAAYTAAASAGGFGVVVIPGGRTYRITDTIETVPGGSGPVWTWGVGAFGGNRIVLLPTVVWDGAANGIMFNTETAGLNIPGALYRNVRLTGRKIANTCIRFGPATTENAKLDTGTGLDEVHVADVLGDAIRVEGIGSTNFWIRGGRWDQIDGYALYHKVYSPSHVSIRDVTWDNWLGSEPNHGKGWIHLDAAGAPTGSHINLHADTCNLEVNAELRETNASGRVAAFKRGVIACTITSAQGNPQFNLTLTNIKQPTQTGNASHSLVQMLGGDGATEADKEIQRAARVSINGRVIPAPAGTDGAATGNWIPFGGIPDAQRPTTAGGTMPSFLHAPTTGSDVFGSARPRTWSYTS